MYSSCNKVHVGVTKMLPEEVVHASLLVYIATSCNCIPVIQTALE